MNKSFIPAIILWHNLDNGLIYFIDGAHRLSAILSYINDDYGDKEISREYYGYNNIPQDEMDLAIETRTYINKKFGSFSDNMKAQNSKSIALKTGSFFVQKIEGNADRAQDSFFKINQQGVVLSPVEKQLCLGRTLPTCLSTRIIVKGAASGQYWKGFTDENKQIITSIATELHTILF